MVKKIIFNIEPSKALRIVHIATFYVYDSSNPNDPELIKMNSFLKNNPNCTTSYWTQSGHALIGAVMFLKK
jgi:hypothetical protein